MNTLRSWAAEYGVSLPAVLELERRLGLDARIGAEAAATPGHTEAHVSRAMLLEAARAGVALFRNNVGALKDERGRVVRYGLANESPAMNRAIKSADFIGIRPVTITPAHVGHVIGQFVSRECKEPGWRYTGTGREVAQKAWLDFIVARGGDAAFVSGPGAF